MVPSKPSSPCDTLSKIREGSEYKDEIITKSLSPLKQDATLPT